MPNWDPTEDRAGDLAHRYALHLAGIYGDDPLDAWGGRRCENCGASHEPLVEIWTDDGTKPRLCEDCADEVRRLEKLADELAAMPGCEERQKIGNGAETTAVLVNRLRAHDQSLCSACTALRHRAGSEREIVPAVPLRDDGKVA